MQQPPSDRSNKNPYATPSAWPRAPQQTFHLRVPKAPPGTQAAAKPAPAPAKPAAAPRPGRQSSILTGSALPVGYTAPQPPPETDLFIVQPAAPAAKPPAPAPRPTVAARPPEPAAEPSAWAPEAEPDVAPAPVFIAPRDAPFPARRPTVRRRENRAPLFIGATAVVAAVMAGAGWLLLREPEPTTATVLEPVAPAPAASEPVITPPQFLGLAPEPAVEAEPVLRGAAEPAQAAPSPEPARRVASVSRPAPERPSGPQPYTGTATPPAPAVATQPLVIPPLPAPPPPASAPGPQTPVADPDSPQTTRDPTSGD